MSYWSTCDLIGVPDDYDRDAGLLGAPSPGVEALVVDETGHPVDPGQTGELRVHTRHLMTGYLNVRETTAAAVDRWLGTGDLATVRTDERLQLFDLLSQVGGGAAPRNRTADDFITSPPGGVRVHADSSGGVRKATTMAPRALPVWS